MYKFETFLNIHNISWASEISWEIRKNRVFAIFLIFHIFHEINGGLWMVYGGFCKNHVWNDRNNVCSASFEHYFVSLIHSRLFETPWRIRKNWFFAIFSILIIFKKPIAVFRRFKEVFAKTTLGFTKTNIVLWIPSFRMYRKCIWKCFQYVYNHQKCNFS